MKKIVRTLNPFFDKIKIMCCEQTDMYMHNHEFFELVYVINGSADHHCSDNSVTVKEGDYFIIDFGTYHSYSNCRDFEIVNCLFKPVFIDQTLVHCKSFSQLITNYLIRFNYTILTQIPVNNIFHDKNNTIRALIESLVNEYKKQAPGYIELMRCSLIEILVLTMRNIAKSDKFYQAHPATVELMEYIDENFANPITLSSLCKKLNFSMPYLSRRFKLDTGMTFNHFLQKTRIEQSCRLLIETDEPIIAIAHSVGYDDIKFFGKVFKQNTKMSPSEFRKLTRNK